jgi:hypothetical protein
MWHERHPRSPVRRRRTRTTADRLLITGTRGSGKRPLGNYLAIQRGFVHLDFDNPAIRARFVACGEDRLRAELAALTKTGRRVVVTWDVSSASQLASIRVLQALGFEWIWFDSDRGSASGGLLADDDTWAHGPRFVDTFTADGRFRPLEPVVAELLEGPVGSRRRGRARVASSRWRATRPVASVPAHRLRVAGALAFASAAAATAGAYLLGAFAGGGVTTTRVAPPRPPALPSQGVLVSGRSLAGVRLGDSSATVRARWGHDFTVCDVCKEMTWFFLPPAKEGSGAGVRFRSGHVTAVFTLGSPRGWHTSDGLRVGQLLERFNDPTDQSKWQYCGTYGAKSTSTADAVTSILTIGQSVYGFALTRPSESPCL